MLIKKHGFRIDQARGRGVALGAGVYMSAKRDWAMDYVDSIRDNWDEDADDEDAALLHLRINPRKPLDIDPKNWPQEMADLYTRRTGRAPAPGRQLDYEEVGKSARKLGFDAVVYDQGTTVVYDPRRIRVAKVEPFPAGEP